MRDQYQADMSDLQTYIQKLNHVFKYYSDQIDSLNDHQLKQ